MMNHHMKIYCGLALAGALFLLAPATVWAQTANNVDCNKCVDTGDIAKKAVKKKNLAKDSVTSKRIADGAVKAKNLADGAVEGSKLAAGAVTGGKIADGAVTGGKLAPNAVDGSKLAANSVGSDKLADGAVTMEKLAPDAAFGRVILVRTDPADQTGNCTALRDTLAGITDNDADNRYTVLLEPGIYDCGGTSVEMKEFVDLQGSGRNVTLIKGSVDGRFNGVVTGAVNAELRRLSVENAGVAAGFATAIFAPLDLDEMDDGPFRITDVYAVARTSQSVAGIRIRRSAAVLTNVLAEGIDATGSVGNTVYGIEVIGPDASAKLENVTATTDNSSNSNSIALVASDNVTARNSVFRSTFALGGGAFGVGAFVSSQLDGLTTNGPPSRTCVDSYDGNYVILLADCS